AIDRMIQRGDLKHRYIPIPDMYANHHGSILRMQEWAQSPLVHRFTIWRSTQRPPTFVASGGDGKLEVHDKNEWESMLAKPTELLPDAVSGILHDYQIPDNE